MRSLIEPTRITPGEIRSLFRRLEARSFPRLGLDCLMESRQSQETQVAQLAPEQAEAAGV